MPNVPLSDSSQADLGTEVDRLLQQLPSRHIIDGQEHRSGPHHASQPRTSGAFTSKTTPRGPSPLVHHVAVWARVLLAAALALAVTSWPYARACGWRLDLYLAVVATVMIAGGWAAVITWRARNAPAHLLALLVVFWGIVLSAEQILPRIEYAASHASWRCGG
ncbi:MAG: hypothetical protein OEW77_04250 [Gemmatimonadota bacterium]|nr:hypothetical protein [Gemmatimonadota bacterium]